MQLHNTKLLPGRCRVAGEWIEADGGASFAIPNPASGELLPGSPVRRRRNPPRRRRRRGRLAGLAGTHREGQGQVLQRWFALINDNAADLAHLITAEGGKPLAEARGEVAYGALPSSNGSPRKANAYGETIPPPSPTSGPGHQAAHRRVPPSPLELSLAMITRKVAPALAAGCPVVVKPAEQTPLTALALAVLAEAAGFPPGVFNVVTGDPVAIGGELTASPTVRKLSFTGSTEGGASSWPSAPRPSRRFPSNWG